ncbi:DUF3967 domain-containing protein [Priestia megaterium]|uniref:DUF3967 domain-containing protein n=1 Tax=Priestia megaterium TaxID=1404 RepID=UPI002E20540F|nr:DUF3967 domain-containing protein [Priestia megaterium]
MNTSEKAYWGKEVAEILQIGESTLRKWCLSLENEGYNFTRGQHKSRAFLDHDILTLRRMKELIQNKDVTLKTASEIVVSTFDKGERTRAVLQENELVEASVPAVPSVRQEELLMEVLERQERLEEQNRLLISRLGEQQKYIDEKLEKRDKQFIEAIRESQETKKLIASALEQQEQREQEEQNKGFFSRLFGKR